MYISNYNVIYLLSNIFGTYTIYKFMTILFNSDKCNKKIEFASYVFYYFAIGAIYIVFNIPLLNLASNLILFFLITLNYSSTWKARFSSVVIIYAILLSAETLTIIIIKILGLSTLSHDVDIELIFELILSKIISYIIVLVMSNFKMLKEKNNITILNWLAVFMIPICTLFSTYIFMTEMSGYNFLQIFISISILFAINIFIFYLYDFLMRYYKEKTDKEILILQNNAYMKQLGIIKQSQENLSILRHDFKFHISSIQALFEKGETEKAMQYLQSSLNSLNTKDEFAKSGYQEVDSILNYKINEAITKDIKIELNLSIPDKLNIEPFDLVAILGNLFDNAIEATSKLSEERKIKIDIRFDRNILYISFVNPYLEIKIENSKLQTTHRDKENHGFGMESVRNAVEKYNGTLQIKHSNHVFYIDAMLYNPAN